MPSKKITDRLIDGEILLLDGGTGSELQRRGVNVLKDATDKLEAWSATANIDNPDVVQQVHQDYLRVGADIITSNNFWTTPTAMDRIGLRNEWEKYATAAVRNAVKARNTGNPEAISATLPRLVDAFDGAVGAYPNIGYNPTGPLTNRPTLTNQLPSAGPDILQAGEYTTSRLAEFAMEWREMGAQIIGGSCATGPEHILAMKPVVKG